MSMFNNAILAVIKTIILVLCAPLVSGVISKVKNIVRMRIGPSILQPYFNVRKLFRKDEVISRQVSWIFYAAPAVVFTGSVCALFLILIAQYGNPGPNSTALLIAAFFVLGLGRFFLALAGLDAASSFGGMGSSREMFISTFAEPAAFIAIFLLGMIGGNHFGVSGLLAGTALAMVTIAETSRVPIDNQETHLELTMIHEAMVLEYSGRSLALIELASQIKQMLFFTVLTWYLFPAVMSARWGWIVFATEITTIGIVAAVIEMSLAKMRLFRAVDFLSFSFFIALVASIAAGMGF